jgi:hypothetical protein
MHCEQAGAAQSGCELGGRGGGLERRIGPTSEWDPHTHHRHDHGSRVVGARGARVAHARREFWCTDTGYP